MNKRTGLVIGGVAAAVVLVGGAATALAASPSPENASGVITGCYTTSEVNGTHALVLQDAGTSCPRGTTALSWNQTGLAGQNGTNGSNGTAGTDGTDGTNGTNGSDVVTSAGVPASACNPGDTDVDLATGEVYSCVAGGGSTGTAGSGAGAGKASPPGNVWSDTGSSIMGQQGTAGQNGTNGTNGTNGSSVVTSAGQPAGVCNLGDTDVDLATGEVYTCVAAGDSIAGDGSGSGAGKGGPAGVVWSDSGSSIMGPQGPAGPGFVLTTGTGTDGPQFSQPGTYYIDAEAGIDDSSDTDVLTGSCRISGANLTDEKQADPMSSIGGSFVLGPGEGENFSFSGIVTVNPFGTSAATPTITCQDTTQAAVTPDSVTWWVSPVSTGS